MKSTFILALTAVVAAGLTLAAGLAAPAGAASDTKACSIVSFADAGTALGGVTITTVTTRSIGTETMCSYHSSDLFKRLEVSTHPFPSVGEAKSYFHSTITSPLKQMSPSVDISGIGDEAHRLGPDIFVRKGDTVYMFTQFAKDTNGAGALRTIALARTAIGRLH